MTATVGPLQGLRVIDTTTTPDAPAASTLLADVGADVVVLEPAGGHRARSVGPCKGDASLLWKATTRNKRSIQLTGSIEVTAPWFDELLARADVLVVEPGYRSPGDDRNVDQIVAAHPHLIVLETSPFGASGPLGGELGSGRRAEAFGGQTFASGDPLRPPLHSGFPIGAATTALLGALGTMAAVLERDHSGRGQRVDVAGYEAVLRYMEFLPIFVQQTGFRNERAGNGSSYQVPVATWLTADDKWVTFTGNTNDIVHRLYRAMGRPELIDDPRFSTNEARVANRDVVEKTLSDWARGITRAELERACAEQHAPVGSVFTMADIFTDANYTERGSLAVVDDDELGLCRVPASVPRFSGGPCPIAGLGGPALVDPAIDDVWPPAAARVIEQPGAVPSGHGPLAGLRVIDMGQILAGPFVATLLADLGADVVKVEKPNGGDDFRRQAPIHKGISLWWKASARNKRSIALDLKDDGDRETFLALVAAADIITANFVPGTLERMNLGYDDLRAVNPRIILVSVSGYGQDGRYRTRRAFGRNAEAYGGLAAVTGYADGVPMPTGFPVADGFSATFGAFGALCARYAQARSGDGVGQHVDVALYETIFRLLELSVMIYDQFGEDPGRSSFGTAAGEAICVAQAAGGAWVSASKWDTGPVRFDADHPYGSGDDRRAAEIDDVRRHIEAHDVDTLLGTGRRAPHDFALTRVAGIDDILASPQCEARSSIVTVADGELGPVSLSTVVPAFSRTPGRIRHASPALDEHRDDIVEEWIKP